VDARLGVGDLACHYVQLPQMTVFRPTPKVSALVGWMGAGSETQSCDSGVFDSELQASLTQIDDKDRPLRHLRVVDSHVMRTSDYMSAKNGERVDMMRLDHSDVGDEFWRTAICVGGIWVILQCTLGCIGETGQWSRLAFFLIF
jgi:hypothetical protein